MELSFHAFVQHTLDFVRDHAAWAPFIVGGLAFCESLAVISFFVPATVILVGIGGLVAASGIPFWPIWFGAVIGAVLGDILSYEVGRYFQDSAHHHWPLSRYPEFTKKADAFTQRWGALGVFLGRFSGPLRAFVPLAAGIFVIPRLLFQAANVASAVLWGFVLLIPGEGLMKMLG